MSHSSRARLGGWLDKMASAQAPVQPWLCQGHRLLHKDQNKKQSKSVGGGAKTAASKTPSPYPGQQKGTEVTLGAPEEIVGASRQVSTAHDSSSSEEKPGLEQKTRRSQGRPYLAPEPSLQLPWCPAASTPHRQMNSFRALGPRFPLSSQTGPCGLGKFVL